MLVVVLVAVCVASMAGYWWLGRTATPGQKALEERLKANRGALRRTLSVPSVFGRMAAPKSHRDASWWTRQPDAPAVPEPDEHKEQWRPR